MRLFWVTTEDHYEDWFVVARDEYEAGRFFEGYEGYDLGEAFAEMVLEIPEEVDSEVGWPSRELLEACGCKYLNSVDATRVVEVNGKRYTEGLMEAMILELTDDVFEASGRGRPNKTVKKTEPEQ